MRYTVIILVFNLLSFTIRSQDDCEKFKSDPIKKISLKVAHVSSKTNGIRSFQSFGVESDYYIRLNKKNKFGINVGLGYYYRTLMKNDGSGNYDGIDVSTMSIYGFTMLHQTLELPISFKYNLLQKKSTEVKISFYAGLSLVYLLKGKVSFTKPELRDILSNAYVPKEDYSYDYFLGNLSYKNDFNQGIEIKTFFPSNNLKTTVGLEYFLYKNMGLGLEYNYFVKPIGKTFRPSFNTTQKAKPNYNNLSLLLIIKF